MSMEPTDYRSVNRANWDERAPAHAASPGYAVERFASDPTFLSDVVRFDVPRLPDLAGMRGVHLQCHIGTDTVSLARLGARMTGWTSPPPQSTRRGRVAAAAGADVDFVEADLYSAPEVLPAGTFDLVFTGIGALCWLPDIRRWADVVATLLRLGGRLFMREGHPMLWALDDRHVDNLVVDFPYFETADPVVWEDPTTYVPTEVEFSHNVTHSWNHGLGEIVTALVDEGFVITQLVEHDSVPWNALPGQMEQVELGEWRLRDRPERLAHSYTLRAVKAG
jgi:SAM-dependent methyltransferase